MIKKKCQIHAGLPITCFEVPIIGNTELNLTPDEIYKCLCAKAEVIEILKDGSKINLDFSNYAKDNTVILPYKGEEVSVVTLPCKKEEVTIVPLVDKYDMGDTCEMKAEVGTVEYCEDNCIDTTNLVELVVEDNVVINTMTKIDSSDYPTDIVTTLGAPVTEMNETSTTAVDTVKTVTENQDTIVELEPEVKVEETASTVKNYKVASRNNYNNNHKKNKNNKR